MAWRYLGGHNAVAEALRAGFPVARLHLAQGARTTTVQELVRLAEQRRVPIAWDERLALNRMAPENHGVVAEVGPYKYAGIEDILAAAASRNQAPLLLAMDGIQDPQNLGSLIRTAEVAGVHGAVIPERRSTEVTAAVARASAGAVFHLPVARVTNLARTLDGLKQHGLWVVGLEANGDELYDEVNYTSPMAIVVGSEGQGLGRLVRQKCDHLVRLPIAGHITSLNAAVAGAVVIFQATRQRQRAAACI